MHPLAKCVTLKQLLRRFALRTIFIRSSKGSILKHFTIPSVIDEVRHKANISHSHYVFVSRWADKGTGSSRVSMRCVRSCHCILRSRPSIRCILFAFTIFAVKHTTRDWIVSSSGSFWNETWKMMHPKRWPDSWMLSAASSYLALRWKGRRSIIFLK